MNRKVKVGIWGMGRAGDGMHGAELQMYPDLFEITAVCDTDAERAEAAGKKYACASFSSPEEFLKSGAMELVAVATFSKDHLRHTAEALSHGYSAVIEKPIALDFETGKELLVLDEKYPGKLFCRQNRRFEPAFHHVREVLASGILGKIHTIKLRRNSFSRRNDWQTLRKNGGGQLNNWGPHLIDQALQLMNYKVASVWGEMKRCAAMGDADDSVKIILRDGAGLTVDVEIFGGAALPSNVYEIYGSRGALSVDPTESDIKMRYIDPSYELKDYPVNEGHPGGFSFSDNATIPWIRQTIMVKPSDNCTMNCFYKAVYDSMTGGVPFPVKAREALEVIRITEEVRRQNPDFK